MCGLVYWREQSVLLTLAPGIGFGVAILLQQTDLADITFIVHPGESPWLVYCDAYILHNTSITILLIVAVNGLQFEVAVGVTLTAHQPPSLHTLVRSTLYYRVKECHIILLRANNIYLNAQLGKAWYGYRVDPLDVFGYLSADVSGVVKHHFGEYRSIERLAMFECEEYGGDAILTEGARGNIYGIIVLLCHLVVRYNPLLLASARGL